MELNGKSISFSSYKKKQQEQNEKEIIKKIESLENNLNSNNIIEVEILKEELNTIRNQELRLLKMMKNLLITSAA